MRYRALAAAAAAAGAEVSALCLGIDPELRARLDAA
jgi:hypothetical protein